MPRKKLFLPRARPARPVAPVATGLVVANLVIIGVAIACVLVTRRAWQLRDDALAALHDAEAQAGTAPASSSGRALPASVHGAVRRLRASTMDRILLCGGLGVAGSAFFTWLLVARSASRGGDVPDRLRRGHSVTGAERIRR